MASSINPFIANLLYPENRTSHVSNRSSQAIQHLRNHKSYLLSPMVAMHETKWLETFPSNSRGGKLRNNSYC